MNEGILTGDCGHHCGIKDNIIGHCKCHECHGYISGLLPYEMYIDLKLKEMERQDEILDKDL